MEYKHYLALDWAQRNMALAHMTNHSNEIKTIDVTSDIKALKKYLEQLKGSKILTFEESSPAQWLYTELKDSVDEIIVCEPYMNHLLKQGPKNDRVDAIKLLRLLKADMLKPVFHCTDEFIHIRKLVSGYEDLILGVVQMKNRRSAMFRAVGKRIGSELETSEERFVLTALEEMIVLAEKQRLQYEAQFRLIRKKNVMVKNLESIPGIGLINAVKIASVVIDPSRFKHTTAFWLYSGLQKYELISGGKSYGKRSPRYCRKLKSVFKTAALVCARTNDGPLRKYYEQLIKERNYPEHQARHALARRIATLALGVMKTERALDESELDKKVLAC
jgi:transposase